METLGLIAGNGQFPLLLARSFKKNHRHRITAVGFKGDTLPELKSLVDEFHWVGVGQLGRLIKLFTRSGVTKAVMAGQITPTRMFKKARFDLKGIALYTGLKDKKADTIFTAVADQMKKEGITLLDSTAFLKDHLPKKGLLARTKPTPEQVKDIQFGQKIAREMSRLDVGQTVVVKDRAIVAVEALEGTDQTIRRGGKLTRSGAVVVKLAKPSQDMRFDVPVIGPSTIKTMIEAKAAVLAIEAGKTLIIDKARVVKTADRHKIALIAI